MYLDIFRIMTDALEGHESTVSIGGRTITNLRFADDIDGLPGEELPLSSLNFLSFVICFLVMHAPFSCFVLYLFHLFPRLPLIFEASSEDIKKNVFL